MEKRKNLLQLITLLSLIIGSISCRTDISPALTINERLAEHGLTPTKLGKQLQNPYSLSNMQMALDSMKTSLESFKPKSRMLRAVNEITIETTDLYVRFLPRDITITQRRSILMICFTFIFNLTEI